MNAASDSQGTAPSATKWESSPVLSKYGEAAKAGFQLVPDLLLKHQTTLEITATDLVVLLNVLMHWWTPDQKPFPRPVTIAKRMGVSTRTVQRSLRVLEDMKVLVPEAGDDGSSYLNPAPLVEKLNEFALSDTDYLVRTGKGF